jgi:hypothetical protein
MTCLPRCENAILDIRKLEDYCLNALHMRGRHKARVFLDALDVERRDAAWLRSAILDQLCKREAEELDSDSYGTRWRVDIDVERQNRTVVIRTIWIIRTEQEAPRFVTCWVR